MENAKALAAEFNIRLAHAENIIKLMDEGATVPFIARYRKELTGSADDQMLRLFLDRLNYLRTLNKKKEDVLKTIEEQGKLTEEIKQKLNKANTLSEVDDIYRPFRPKRKTRASVAIEKGLKPFAELILKQLIETNLKEEAKKYINEEKEVLKIEDVLKGASDIIAEIVSDDADVRKSLREFTLKTAQIQTELKESEKSKTYDMYNNHKEEVSKIPSHRILAINRGEKEKCLKVKIFILEEKALNIINKEYLKGESESANFVLEAIKDSFDRLIYPAIEREVRNILTDKASEQAIKMFEVNLKPLLLQPPLKGKVILGVDPAFRTGCKLAVIDENSNVLDVGVAYPTPPKSDIRGAEIICAKLIKKHEVTAIAIGNGTATKETEIFIANLIKKLDPSPAYMVVNEAGASVYSASKLGAEEFPNYDVSLRSAVSIARRLQDPLAELIKIDVRAIGVGQYQHDMPQKRLTEVLEGVVETCVNSVGVDLNTASPSLLSYISGLNKTTAKNIELYRKENGPFVKITELKKVAKLGAKAFEQSAGFLRIPNAPNVLDNTGVHPESYKSAELLLKEFNLTKKDLKTDKIDNLESLVKLKGKEFIAENIGVGVPTLEDMMEEICKPGRDIRDALPKPELKSDVLSIEDLTEGMIIKGTVRNVIDFGAFVDIGVHQDGLVHISEISDRYIKHPSEELTVGDVVNVKILSVDLDKNRISLSIKKAVEN